MGTGQMGPRQIPSSLVLCTLQGYVTNISAFWDPIPKLFITWQRSIDCDRPHLPFQNGSIPSFSANPKKTRDLITWPELGSQ